MLDTQCSPKTPSSKEGFEHAQSCVLIIELPADQQSNGHVQKRFESSCVKRKKQPHSYCSAEYVFFGDI